MPIFITNNFIVGSSRPLSPFPPGAITKGFEYNLTLRTGIQPAIDARAIVNQLARIHEGIAVTAFIQLAHPVFRVSWYNFNR